MVYKIYVPSLSRKLPISPARVVHTQILDGDKVPAISCTLDKENCNDKETAYIDKIAAWDAPKATQELERVKKVMAEKSTCKEEEDKKCSIRSWSSMRTMISVINRVSKNWIGNLMSFIKKVEMILMLSLAFT